MSEATTDEAKNEKNETIKKILVVQEGDPGHNRTYSNVIAFFVEKKEDPFVLMEFDKMCKDGQPFYAHYNFPLHHRMLLDWRKKFASIQFQGEEGKTWTVAVFCRVQDDNEPEKVHAILNDLNKRIQPYLMDKTPRKGYKFLVTNFVEKIATGYNYPKKDKKTGNFIFGRYPNTGPPFIPKSERKARIAEAAHIAEQLKKNFAKAKTANLAHIAELLDEIKEAIDKDPLGMGLAPKAVTTGEASKANKTGDPKATKDATKAKKAANEGQKANPKAINEGQKANSKTTTEGQKAIPKAAKAASKNSLKVTKAASKTIKDSSKKDTPKATKAASKTTKESPKANKEAAQIRNEAVLAQAEAVKAKKNTNKSAESLNRSLLKSPMAKTPTTRNPNAKVSKENIVATTPRENVAKSKNPLEPRETPEARVPPIIIRKPSPKSKTLVVASFARQSKDVPAELAPEKPSQSPQKRTKEPLAKAIVSIFAEPQKNEPISLSKDNNDTPEEGMDDNPNFSDTSSECSNEDAPSAVLGLADPLADPLEEPGSKRQRLDSSLTPSIEFEEKIDIKENPILDASLLPVIKLERLDEPQLPSSTTSNTNNAIRDDALEDTSTMKDIQEMFKRNEEEISTLKRQVQDHLLDKMRLQKQMSEKMQTLRSELTKEKAQNQDLLKQIAELSQELSQLRASAGAKEKLAKLEKLGKVFYETCQKLFHDQLN